MYHTIAMFRSGKENGCIVDGGIVYLNKQPDKDTGTSIYKPKNGFAYQDEYSISVKRSHFMSRSIDDDTYEKEWKKNYTQYTKTVTVDAEYNRLFLFNNKIYHGVETYGSTQPRLTLAFFSERESSMNSRPPLLR